MIELQKSPLTADANILEQYALQLPIPNQSVLKALKDCGSGVLGWGIQT